MYLVSTLDFILHWNTLVVTKCMFKGIFVPNGLLVVWHAGISAQVSSQYTCL